MVRCHTAPVKDNRDERTLGHIGSAGHDLKRLAVRAHLHLADDQFVRIRMRRDGQHLRHNNLLEILIQALEPLYLRTAQGHRVRVFLCRTIKVRNIGLDPR